MFKLVVFFINIEKLLYYSRYKYIKSFPFCRSTYIKEVL